MDLPPERLEQIRQILEEELRRAYQDALDRGVPAATADEVIADRHRALEELALRFTADRPEHPLDDPVEGGGVGQEH